MTAAKTNGTAPKGLHAKLAEVMGEVDRIPKKGTAPAAMGGFKFVQVGDAADVIRKALAAVKVSMLPTAIELLGESEHETSTKKVMTTLLVRQTWTLTDGETGETATIQSIGAGADTGDKAAPKAMTAGMKYAILTGFLMSTGDDPETADTSDRQVRVTNAEGETLTLIGIDTVSGIIKKGDDQRYQCEWRDMPDGAHVIGFALKRNGDKDFPQVGIMGEVAATLYASGDFPLGPELIGQKVTMKGRFYAVRQTGRSVYTRVIVGQGSGDFLETDDWRFPALLPDATETAVAEAEHAEAAPEPLWDGLTDEEKALIAEGAPG
jgi:hypothetical protein